MEYYINLLEKKFLMLKLLRYFNVENVKNVCIGVILFYFRFELR